MSALLDLDAIRRAHPLPAVVGAVVKLQRAGGELKACCPFHADRSPSFTIFDGGQRFHCFGCGASGDVLDFVQRAHGVSLRDAADMLTGGNLPTVQKAPLPIDNGVDRISEARALWEASTPIKGTLAERYLRSRSIHAVLPDTVRFASLPYGKRGPNYPVLVAAVQDVGGELTGVQRTFLNSAGTGKADVRKAKLSLGKIAGGAIRLAPVAGHLLVAEGIEDAATVMQEIGIAAWAAGGASMLPAMLFPPQVQTVSIAGDGDAAGHAAADKAAAAYSRRGLLAQVFFPPSPFKDFNQLVMETRA